MRSAEIKKAVLSILEDAAAKGERCPTNPEIALALSRAGKSVAGQSVPGVISDLIRDGKITATFFNQRTRAVTIREGPHAGKATSVPANYTTPAWVIDRDERQRRDVASAEGKKDRVRKRRGFGRYFNV